MNFLFRFQIVSLDRFYNLPLIHASPWFIGVILAYMNQCLEINLTESQKKLRWILSCLGVVAVEIFHGLVSNFALGMAVYDTIKRTVWGLHIGWVIFAFHDSASISGYKNFLSHKFWQPLSRLALAIYLTHHIYINLTVANIKQTSNFGFMWSVHILLGDLVVTAIIGALMFLFVEAPISKLTNF